MSSSSFYRVQILQNKRTMKISARLLLRESHNSILEPERSLTLFWKFELAYLDFISPHLPCSPTVISHKPFFGALKKEQQIDIETNWGG